MTEAANRRKLLEDVPFFKGLTKAPPNNAPKQIQHDQLYMSWYNQLHSILRPLTVLTMRMQGEAEIPEAPDNVTLAQTTWALVRAVAVQIHMFRLHSIDPRLVPHADAMKLVDGEGLKLVTDSQKVSKAFKGSSSSASSNYKGKSYHQHRYHPYSNGRGYGGGSGQSKGSKGFGKSQSKGKPAYNFSFKEGKGSSNRGR